MAITAISTELQERVTNELTWDPQVTSPNIGVTSNDGMVMLSGFVSSYAERMAAEQAALRVRGTRGVANELVVRLAGERIDPDVAQDAVRALKFNLSVPPSVKVSVHNGHLTLEGNCEWRYQREAAEKAVRGLAGVRGVSNYIAVSPRVSPELVKDKIEDALRRSALLDAKTIRVSSIGPKVTLTGEVKSYAERREAERAAWAAPGVSDVVNNVIVNPPAF